jgi:glutamine amidotransferase-like uncharacterized protein
MMEKNVKSFAEFHNTSNLRAGVYFGEGVKDSTVETWTIFFKKYFSIDVKILTTSDFVLENMKKLDLVVLPGGSSAAENAGMTDDNKNSLKKWLNDGGKILAVCAGFYLICDKVNSNYDDDGFPQNIQSLGLIPIKTIDYDDSITNDPTTTKLSFTEAGKKAFGVEVDQMDFIWHGGPVLQPDNEGKFVPLMHFAEELPHSSEHIQDFVKGKIASIYARVGNGHVIANSPHIEKAFTRSKVLANVIDFLLSR